jgi:hypothetical protein
MGSAVSDATPGTVTIRIPASRTAELRSPGRSLTDGGPHPVLVQTWAINYPFRPRRLTLAVDAATARQVKRYNWTVAALVLTCMAAVLVSGGYIVAVLLGTRLFPALLLLLPLLILVAGLGVVVMVKALRQRPRIYPGASTPDEILIVGVDRGAAEEWRGANEPGVVTIVEPGH